MTTRPPCSTAAASSGAPAGSPGRGPRPPPPVQVPDDDGDPAEPFDVQPLGHVPYRRDRCLDKRRPEREILDGIPGQRHLGKHDDPRPPRGRPPRPFHDDLSVPREIPNGRVHLRKPNSHHNHEAKLRSPRDWPSVPAAHDHPERVLASPPPPQSLDTSDRNSGIVEASIVIPNGGGRTSFPPLGPREPSRPFCAPSCLALINAIRCYRQSVDNYSDQ